MWENRAARVGQMTSLPRQTSCSNGGLADDNDIDGNPFGAGQRSTPTAKRVFAPLQGTMFPPALVLPLGPPHPIILVAVGSWWAGAVGDNRQVEVAGQGPAVWDGDGTQPTRGPCWAHTLVNSPLTLTSPKRR